MASPSSIGGRPQQPNPAVDTSNLTLLSPLPTISDSPPPLPTPRCCISLDPYVCVTWSEPFPRLLVTRDKPRRGGGPEDRYYGPFVDAGQVRSTLALMRRVLPLRERARPLYKDKPCLNFDLGLCPGPCQGLVSEEDYAETVRLAEAVLRGEGGVLLSRLRERMEGEARAERFERAAEIKEQVALVRGGLLGSALHFSSRGVVAGGGGSGELSGDSAAEGGGVRRDVVAVGLAGGLACFQVFQVRGGGR